MSETFQLIWAILSNVFFIFFGLFVFFGIIIIQLEKYNIVLKILNVFKFLYEKLVKADVKGAALICLIFSIIFNYFLFKEKSSICDGCEPPKEFHLKYHDYTNGGDFVIGKDFIIQTESEFSNLGSRENPKLNVKFIKTLNNKFSNFPRYYVVNLKSNCNPYKEYIGLCEFYYYFVIDIVCEEPYVHLKILQDDLKFFRDYYYFPHR